jgi:cytidine deaminase
MKTNKSAAEKEFLMAEAEKARTMAYAPYSCFSVGAALSTPDGRVYCGCNVENASYGLTCCAERAALFSAVVQGSRQFKALALAGEDGIIPCGACLQVLREFAPHLLIYFPKEGKIETALLSDLLPNPFIIPPGRVGERL